jgi:peptidoglycan/xylan/chitin deacetylase (PgdA/CDA1 family)
VEFDKLLGTVGTLDTMARRPDLGWAGAGVLIAMAAVSLTQAATLRDPTPVRAQPFPAVHATPARPSARVPAPAEPAREPEAVIPPGRSSVRVPILMYHYIRVNPDPRDKLGFNLSVTPGDFTRQMDWLAGNGYHPVDLSDLRAYLLGHATLPSKPVVLTFDDGYRDMYTAAFPILRAHHFKGVAYIVSGFVNSPNNVTAEQVLEMDANGIEIGVHTVSHADLTRISAGDLHREVFDSKAWLEGLLGHPVHDFCYPSGRFNAGVIAVVQAAGFDSATTTEPGNVHSAGDRFTWTRVRVSGGESLEQLIGDLGQPEGTQMMAQGRPTAAPRAGLARLPVTFPIRPPPEALSE